MPRIPDLPEKTAADVTTNDRVLIYDKETDTTAQISPDELMAGKQSTDADLTAIAVLAPSNNDVLQRKSGAWTNRTPAQLKADLALGSGDLSDFNSATDGRIAAQKGVVNGLATLDSGGKIPNSQIPATAITDVFTVNTEAAMLSLTAQAGDVAIRTDNGKSYILSTNSPGTLADWKEITATDATVNTKVSRSGDTMTGPLVLAADPLVALGAATKQYVDNVAGGSNFAILIPNLVGDGITDDSAAIQAALDAVGVSSASNILIAMSPVIGGSIYINQFVSIQTDNVKLRFASPVVLGPNGSLKIQGELKRSSNGKLTTSASVPAGATSVTLATGTVASLGFVVGDLLVIHGNRDANGNALWHETNYITAITGDTLTLKNPLQNAYAYSYANTYGTVYSEWAKGIGSAITGGNTRGSTVLTVASTANFTVGDIVQVNDATMTWDPGSGTYQASNFPHREMAEVKAIVDATHLQISHPLYHTYDLAQNAQVTIVLAVSGSEITGVQATFSGGVGSGVANYGIEVKYANNCHVETIEMVGTGPQAAAPWGNSWNKQAVRFFYAYHCTVGDLELRDPARTDSGSGYGLTFYGSTECNATNVKVTSARHSILFFDGAAGNEVEAVISEDCGYSDIDFHGAECTDNLIDGFIVTGGTTNPMNSWSTGSGPVFDTSPTRAALRLGNPSHTPGDCYNSFKNGKIVNYSGYAFEIIADSHDNSFENIDVQGAARLFYLVPATGLGSSGQTLYIDNNKFKNLLGADFTSSSPLINADGGTSKVIRGLTIDGLELTRLVQGLTLNNASDVSISRITLREPAMATSQYLIKLNGIDGVCNITDNDATGAYYFLSATNVPNGIVTRNKLINLVGTRVYLDGGGNTNLFFAGNFIYGYTPTTSGTFTGAVLDITVAPGVISATGSTVGGLQLTGDLSGTATNPKVLTSNGSTIATLAGTQTFTGAKTFNSNITLGDGTSDIVLGTTTGSRLGTSSTQKLAFYGATAIVRPTGDILTALGSSGLGLIGSPTISEADVTNLTTDLAAKATDTAVVHLAGTETITGTKTFSANPTISNATQSELDLVRSTYTAKIYNDGNLHIDANGQNLWLGGGAIQLLNNMVVADAVTMQLGTTTGTKIGTATNQKLAFFNATPVVQPSGNISTALKSLGLVTAPYTVAWSPEDQGIIAWNYDASLAAATGSALTTAGTLYVAKLYLPVAASITNILVYIGTAGSGLTTGQCFAALYQGAAGAKLGVTADQATAWASTGLKTMAISAGPVSAAAGYLYVAFWFNGTTGPSFKRSSSNASMNNLGLTNAQSRWGSADTGKTTTAPDPLGAITATFSEAFWVGLS